MEFDSADQVRHMLSVPGSYSRDPGFVDLFNHSFTCIRHYYFHPLMWRNYSVPSHFIRDFKRLFHMGAAEFGAMLAAALAITLIRVVFERIPCRILMDRMGIASLKARQKTQESIFKAIFYLFTWTFVFVCVSRLDSTNMFERPWTIWENWQIGMEISPIVKLIYFIEGGFYMHSIYATVYMDVIRRDFAVIIVHHIVTILLIVASFGVRYHRAGLLVLLCHDINDVFLEITKVFLNLESKRWKRQIEAVKVVGMSLFTASWIYFRLYKFPLGVIYSTLVVSCYTAYEKNAGLYGPLNSLLLVILLLDIYWFWYISTIIFNRITGRSKQIDDIREYDCKVGKRRPEQIAKGSAAYGTKNGVVRRPVR